MCVDRRNLIIWENEAILREILTAFGNVYRDIILSPTNTMDAANPLPHLLYAFSYI